MLLDTPEIETGKSKMMMIIGDLKKLDYETPTNERVVYLMNDIIDMAQVCDRETKGQFSTALKTIEDAAIHAKSRFVRLDFA